MNSKSASAHSASSTTQHIPLFRFRVITAWEGQYAACFVSRCLETGSVATADTAYVAEDMMSELLLDECAFAIEHHNLPNLTSQPSPLSVFEEFVAARATRNSTVVHVTIDRNANPEQTLEVEYVRLDSGKGTDQ